MTPNTELSDQMRAAMSRIEDGVASQQMSAAYVFTKMRELVNHVLAASPAPLREADEVRAALEELVSCHFSVIEHPDPEEEARRSHKRMAAAWKQALKALGKWRAAPSGIEADGDGGKGLAQLDAQWWMEHRADIIQALSDKGLQIVSNKERVWLSPTSPPNGKTEGDVPAGVRASPTGRKRLCRDCADFAQDGICPNDGKPCSAGRVGGTDAA
jgi:hypothetical protein